MSGLSAVLKIGGNDVSVLASQPAKPNPSNFKFERPDWVLFRSVGTLSQKAGVPKQRLRRLVIKELVDNALDAGAKVDIHQRQGDDGRTVYSIRDDGPGIDGTPSDIATMFSINRPLVSSKLWRMPQCGALGNGLRVVAGAVAASGGWLRVSTRNRRMIITPQDDGTSAVESELVDFPVGTLIEITLGSEIPDDAGAMSWARAAMSMSIGSVYTGNTSPHFYDGDAFYELLQGAGDRPARDLIASLDGCTGAKAGSIAAPFKGRACRSLGRDEAVRLLLQARGQSKPVRPERLGAVGELHGFTGYGSRKNSVVVGGRAPKATIPFVVEAWAKPGDGSAQMFINRTPITGNFKAYFNKREMTLFGSGLHIEFKVPMGTRFDAVINVTTPYCPITTDGKEPDLSVFDSGDDIIEAVQRALNGARRAIPRTPADERQTQKSIVLANLDGAIDKASGDRQFRFNPRQVFYVLRPIVQNAIGAELTEGNFQNILTEYEAEHGDIPLMYRDPRGVLYHPHTGETIPLGTIAVEEYTRPEWTFNKILCIEKEGWFESLKAMLWPEFNDCALMTSKGNFTRAARDLLDFLGDHPEPITVFCIHDADAAGSMIFQTLQEETKARARRRVEIINLGLEPWEAIEMGLDVETVKRDREAPVADYIKGRADGEHWRQWLQHNRVELNAMTTPALVEWLDRKMRERDGGKVVPPIDIVTTMLEANVEEAIRRAITDNILREANIDDQVADEMSITDLPDITADQLADWLRVHPKSYGKTGLPNRSASSSQMTVPHETEQSFPSIMEPIK
jgi:hypothetical protein